MASSKADLEQTVPHMKILGQTSLQRALGLGYSKPNQMLVSQWLVRIGPVWPLRPTTWSSLPSTTRMEWRAHPSLSDHRTKKVDFTTKIVMPRTKAIKARELSLAKVPEMSPTLSNWKTNKTLSVQVEMVVKSTKLIRNIRLHHRLQNKMVENLKIIQDKHHVEIVRRLQRTFVKILRAHWVRFKIWYRLMPLPKDLSRRL